MREAASAGAGKTLAAPGTSDVHAPTVLVAVDADGIATLTINRSKHLNALNGDVLDELKDAILDLKGRGVRALIVTGSGDRAFVAGADIAQMAVFNPIEKINGVMAAEFSRNGQAVFNEIARFPGPVVAAVSGYALGGGLELAMACDIILAADNAKLGQPEVKLGVVPGFGGSQRLPRRVGQSMAKLLLMTGDTIDAAEALRIGLVDRVVPTGQLLEETRSMLRRILHNGPLAVAAVKRIVDKGAHLSLRDAMDRESDAFGALFETSDQKEGMRAFLEKRKPNFQGR